MIRTVMNKRFKGLTWKSGHIYEFKYQAWHNDPQPTIILMYAFDGIHPTTGRQWRFFQGINFTYIPRPSRRLFAAVWLDEWQRNNGNVQFTYGRVLSEFSFLKDAVRRYFYSPDYYIQNAREIYLEDMEQAIVSTWTRDFSRKLKVGLIQKYRDVIGRVMENPYNPGRRRR